MPVRNMLMRLLGCALLGLVPLGPALGQTAATVVWYQEQEPGIQAYPVRYIVTPGYMRSDDGRDDGDFLLYDRKQRKIYSVARDNRTVLEIDGSAPAPQVPDGLSISVREHQDEKAPLVSGRAPLELELVAQGQVCHSAVVVPGFLELVRTALQEYNQALAVQQLRILDRTPKDFQTPCFLSRYLYASDFHFARGMVLADWNESGDRREMTSYKTAVPIDDSLFVVPGDYRVISAAGN